MNSNDINAIKRLKEETERLENIIKKNYDYINEEFKHMALEEKLKNDSHEHLRLLISGCIEMQNSIARKIREIELKYNNHYIEMMSEKITANEIVCKKLRSGKLD